MFAEKFFDYFGFFFLDYVIDILNNDIVVYFLFIRIFVF